MCPLPEVARREELMSQLYGRLAQASGRERLRREMRDGYRRSLRLTALGTLLPGAGLTRTRHRIFGWVLVVVVVAVTLLVGFSLLTQGVMATALSFVSNPTALEVAAVGALVLGVVWAASIILTAISSRPSLLDRTRTRGLAIFTAFMVAVVAASSYKAAEYALITKDTIVDVFGKSSGNPHEAKVVAGEDPWAVTPRVNILIIGSDAGSDRTGTRTDSMIVASIDTKTGRSVLIQLPRSLERAPLAPDSPLRRRYPSGFFGYPDSSCDQGLHGCLLTNLWMEAQTFKQANPTAYPGDSTPGRTEIRSTIQEITGLTIDHMVIVDLRGFEQLIDAMGGVDINVKGGGYDGRQPLPIGGHRDQYGVVSGVKSYFKIGPQHLNGYYALWYARSRAADDDTHRQARQRCVIRAIINQVNPAAMFAKYAELAQILKNNIYTDIPADHLPAFVELIERVKKGKIVSLPLTPDHKIYAGNPDYALIRELVKKAIAPPPAAPKPHSSASPTSRTGSGSTRTAHPTPSATNSVTEADAC